MVVETTNFTDKTAFRGSGKGLHVIERFTLVNETTMLYEFTVEDKASWSQPWSVELPMVKTEGPMYEYTCHERNYGMVNTLRGARRVDKEIP